MLGVGCCGFPWERGLALRCCCWCLDLAILERQITPHECLPTTIKHNEKMQLEASKRLCKCWTEFERFERVTTYWTKREVSHTLSTSKK